MSVELFYISHRISGRCQCLPCRLYRPEQSTGTCSKNTFLQFLYFFSLVFEPVGEIGGKVGSVKLASIFFDFFYFFCFIYFLFLFFLVWFLNRREELAEKSGA